VSHYHIKPGTGNHIQAAQFNWKWLSHTCIAPHSNLVGIV